MMEMMNWELFMTFIALNIINVIIQTVKSLCTIKCGKVGASLVNALAYGFYTIVVVYMVCELPLWLKVLVVGLCNLVGVFLVKWGEEKARKDKLWKVEMTVKEQYTNTLSKQLTDLDIPYNYIPNVGKYSIFNIYCSTQRQSSLVKEIGFENKAKFFVSETKSL